MDKYEVVGESRKQLDCIYTFSVTRRGPFRLHTLTDIVGATRTVSLQSDRRKYRPRSGEYIGCMRRKGVLQVRRGRQRCGHVLGRVEAACSAIIALVFLLVAHVLITPSPGRHNNNPQPSVKICLYPHGIPSFSPLPLTGCF